jgi:serine protease Do
VGSDENSEFARYVFQSFCQGVIEGRYRQFSLSPLPGRARGAPLYNQTGELVGLVNPANAWVLSDLVVDLNELLARATGEAPSPEDSEDAWFGAILAPINADYAQANDLPRSALWMIHVFEDGSAAKAGFQSGDLLVRLNDEPLRLSGSRAYQYFVQTLRPRKGKKFTATVLRGKKEYTGSGVITNREEPDTLKAEDLGITVTDINEPMVVRLNLRQSEGVVVSDVDPGSPAATGRTFGNPLLRPRDLITAIGGIPTPDIEAFGQALDTIRQEQRKDLLVEFWRGPVSGYEALNLRIGDQDNGD